MSQALAEALAVCATRLGDVDGGPVIARLGGSLGVTALAELRALTAGAVGEGARRRAAHAAVARAVVPQGQRLVDSSWLEAALADLPPRARAAVASGGGDPIDVWLARWATAALPPMPVAPWHHELEPLLAGDAGTLARWLDGVGADQLVHALGAALDTASARGERVRDAIAVARQRAASAPRAGNLGPQRAAIARCRGIALTEDDALLVIGVRALAPHLSAEPLLRLALTRRFARARGLRLHHELHAHAATPVAHAPTWAALLAR